MKRLPFIIMLIGLFILLFMLTFSSPITINSPSELTNLAENTKVQTTGRVVSERILYEQTKLLKLDNNLEITCNACPSYINRTLTILGTSEIYINRTQITTLRIKTINS